LVRGATISNLITIDNKKRRGLGGARALLRGIKGRKSTWNDIQYAIHGQAKMKGREILKL
jgi:hypothetical protein